MEVQDNNIRKLQVVKFEVKKGQTYEFNGNTKTEHDRIKGIFLRLSNQQALPGATLRVWIDDTEIIPDDTEEESAQLPETNVEITDIGTANTPEDRKKVEIIKKLSDALMTWELQDVAKIANIVGLCLDKAELINKTLLFLNQAVNGISEQEPWNAEFENEDLDN